MSAWRLSRLRVCDGSPICMSTMIDPILVENELRNDATMERECQLFNEYATSCTIAG